jgi:hypothetical protein
MLLGLPIEVKPVVETARHAFCGLLHAHTSSPATDTCLKRHAGKYNTHMVLDGGEDGHAKLPVPCLPLLTMSYAYQTVTWAA